MGVEFTMTKVIDRFDRNKRRRQHQQASASLLSMLQLAM